MATHELAFVPISEMSTSAYSTFHSAGGWGLYSGSTIFINADAAVETLTVEDNDATFDDDDFDQSLAIEQTLDGVTYPAGTQIEPEYALVVADSEGHEYRMLAISQGGNPYTIIGFVFMDEMPPFGETLTWVWNADGVQFVDPYDRIAPACFTPGTLIALPDGREVSVETLQAGDLVLTRDHGPQPLRLVARQHLEFTPEAHPHKPVQIKAGALGRGLPRVDLLVSPQHRMLMCTTANEPVLVPAKALLDRAGVRAMSGLRQTDYVHLIFDRHEIVFANGAPSESFLPGKMALAALDGATRNEVFEIFPELRHSPALPEVHGAHKILGVKAAVREAQRIQAA